MKYKYREAIRVYELYEFMHDRPAAAISLQSLVTLCASSPRECMLRSPSTHSDSFFCFGGGR